MQVPLPDGRKLEVLVDGPEDGLPLVWHSGTPNGAALDEAQTAAAAAQGLRVVALSRPGYGASTRQPGRSVADVAADTAAVLDRLGAGAFVTAGASGGGPHALACAALLPDRCRAAATVAGVAPYEAAGLDFLAGMGEENVGEFGAALQGEAVLRPLLEAWSADMATITGPEVAEALGGLVPPVDVAALTGAYADWLARALRNAGADGWIDDDLAFIRPWGFDLAALTVPVTVWQGDQDLMVPFAHGQWLAANVPGATARLLDGHGHLSLVADHLPAILADLVA